MTTTEKTVPPEQWWKDQYGAVKYELQQKTAENEMLKELIIKMAMQIWSVR